MTNESKKQIVIKGAREHNLQDIDVSVPRDEFIVITGISGSGKSSLAFDTIYAEGQRRYVESLSAYARQFLGQMKKPEMESIEGLSPAISIDQKTTRENPIPKRKRQLLLSAKREELSLILLNHWTTKVTIRFNLPVLI